MALMNRKVAVVLKLPQLQNLIKRDPLAYREEFAMQKRHFDSELEIFRMRPTTDNERFTELVTFMSHVVGCYKEEATEVPVALMELLQTHAMTLHPDVRAKLVQALILLRSKNVIEPIALIRLAFRLFSVPDKTLRIMLGEYIVNDIKAINANKHNDKLNKGVQSMLFDIVTEENSIAARKTINILAELYRRRVWTDARCVNVMGEACKSSITRVFVSAMNFFLGIETKMHEDEDDEKKANVAEVNYHEHSKKTRKRQRTVEKQMSKNTKARKDAAEEAQAVPLFPAIQLLHDPQSLAECVFKKLHKSGERFEVRLLMMNFLSRLIGCHKLILLNFFSFIQRYLTAHQKEVTKILAYLIQGCHELVPPEELVPVVRAIAYHFITERCTAEVLTVGLNAVREIMSRVPFLLREQDMGDLVQDLVQYTKKNHKNVMIAARSILNFVRETYPVLLRQKDRGKFHNIQNVPGNYGEQKIPESVPGSELLEAYERGDIYIDEDDNVCWREDRNVGPNPNQQDDGWEECEDGSEEEDDEQDDDEEAPDLVDVNSGDEMDHENSDASEDAWESCSDEEDEDGSEQGDGDEESKEAEEEEENSDDWVSVDDDVEDNSVSDMEAVPENDSNLPKPKKDVRERVEARRLLTDEDFKMISRLRMAYEQRLQDPRNRRHVKASGKEEEGELDDEESSPANDFRVDPSSLEPRGKSAKATKIERLTRVLEGRRENKFEIGGHAGGLTNKEKERKKNFVMVRKGKESVRGKINKSNSDRRYEQMHRREQFGRDKRKRRRT